MIKWFDYKGTISGKTYFLRTIITAMPAVALIVFLDDNYYAVLAVEAFLLYLLMSLRYKRVNAVFNESLDLGKKLFFTSLIFDIALLIYGIIDIESYINDTYTTLDLILGIPLFIFIMYITFKDSKIKRQDHKG